MGLLTKTVMMKWRKNNKEWYENKGYIYTQMGCNLEVKVEDLTKGSHTIVDVKCDGCGEILHIVYKNYIRYVHNNERYYCRKCSMTLFGKNKTVKTRLNNGISKSFEQWCISNDRQDILNRWDYELNDCKPSEIQYGTRIKYFLNCPCKRHKSELKDFSHVIRRKDLLKCKQCNSFAQWGIDNIGKDFLEKYWSDKNILNPWEVSYKNNKKVWIKCQEKDYHQDYETCCSYFIIGGRCPYCVNKLIHPKDSLGEYIIDNFGQDFLDKIWSDKNDKSAFEYSPNSGEKVWWNCLDGKHEDYYRKIHTSNQCEFRCSQCVQEMDESILQNKVRLYLEETNYIILHENKCTIVPKNPKTKHILPFDNEIKELKLICEVNGLQHYEITNWTILSARRNNTTLEYELYYQQLKDRYKRISAIQQGYFYLEIPYWMDNKKETWKQLINNKINEIRKEIM